MDGVTFRLDDLSADPKRIGELTHGEASALMLRVSALLLALSSRVAATLSASSNEPGAAPDRLLNVDEAGQRLGMARLRRYTATKTAIRSSCATAAQFDLAPMESISGLDGGAAEKVQTSAQMVAALSIAGAIALGAGGARPCLADARLLPDQVQMQPARAIDDRPSAAASSPGQRAAGNQVLEIPLPEKFRSRPTGKYTTVEDTTLRCERMDGDAATTMRVRGDVIADVDGQPWRTASWHADFARVVSEQ